MARVKTEDQEAWYAKAAEAAKLRRLGYHWAEVAIELGYPSPGAACAVVKRLLERHQSLAYHEIALYRQESLDRLTDLLRTAMPLAIAGDEKMMREARLIISQIGDLTGEKAPQKIEIGGSDVDRLLRDALDEFNSRAQELDRKAGRVQTNQGGDS